MVKTAAESLQAISHDSSALLVFGGWLGGERCHSVLVDAGVLQLRLLQLGAATQAEGRAAESSAGSRAGGRQDHGQSDRAVQVDDALVNGSSAPCRLVVMDQLSHDVILGLPWLRAAGVVLGCGPVITWNGKPLPLRAAGARHRRSRICS